LPSTDLATLTVGDGKVLIWKGDKYKLEH
jgi:hypothetical protein